MIKEKGIKLFKSKRGENISKALTGRRLSSEHIEKIRQNTILGITGMKGRKHKAESKLKTSKSLRGENHPRWKGGVSGVYGLIRGLSKYQEWRNEILKRDDFTCQFCGVKQGWNKQLKIRFYFEVDHIIPLCVLIHKHNIQNSEQAILCDAIWNISNGRSLCKECHKKTETYNKNLEHQII